MYGQNGQNGLMTSSSLYSIKYLSEFFVFVKITFVDFFIFKIYALSTHSYTWLKKQCKKVLIVI